MTLINRIFRAKPFLFAILFSLFSLIIIQRAQALEFENGGVYSSDRHDRFVLWTFPDSPVPNPDFFLAAYESQLAGVGWNPNNIYQKVALISPQHFLNANHWKVWGSVTFLNQDGVLKTYEVESNTTIDGDVAIGKLRNPILPEDKIPFYPLIDTDPNASLGKDVIYIGRAPGSNRFAAGRTGILQAGLSGSTVGFDSNLVPEEFSIDRVQGIGYDSGSPTFLIQDGKLALVGHHYTDKLDGLVGHCRNGVDALLAADGYLLDIVTEQLLGNPQGVVITHIPNDNTIDFPLVRQLGLSSSSKFMVYNFSSSTATVSFLTSNPDFASTNQLEVPGNAGRCEAEIVFTPSYYGDFTETLWVYISLPGAPDIYTIDLAGSAIDEPVGSPLVGFAVAYQKGCDGQKLDYPFEITNCDVPGYPASTFEFSIVLPSGWSGKLLPSSLTLAPGEKGTNHAYITPPVGTTPGEYMFTLHVTDSLEPLHETSVSAVYDVYPDTIPPKAPVNLHYELQKGGKELNLLWYMGPEVKYDDVGVARFEAFRDGVMIGWTWGNRNCIIDSTIQSGATYVYTVVTIDLAGNVSPESTLTVTIPSKGGGGGKGGGKKPPKK